MSFQVTKPGHSCHFGVYGRGWAWARDEEAGPNRLCSSNMQTTEDLPAMPWFNLWLACRFPSSAEQCNNSPSLGFLIPAMVAGSHHTVVRTVGINQIRFLGCFHSWALQDVVKKSCDSFMQSSDSKSQDWWGWPDHLPVEGWVVTGSMSQSEVVLNDQCALNLFDNRSL